VASATETGTENQKESAAALYGGVVEDSNGSSAGSSISMLARPEGVFSGRIVMGGESYAIPPGKFDSSGHARVTVATSGRPLVVDLQRGGANGSEITGTISDGVWTSKFETERAMASNSGELAKYAGNYALAMNGVVRISISRAGQVVIKAKVNSQPVSEATVITQSGRVPIYLPYGDPKTGSAGVLSGWLSFTKEAGPFDADLFNAPGPRQIGFTNTDVPVRVFRMPANWGEQK
jgi:hypothetical protein